MEQPKLEQLAQPRHDADPGEGWSGEGGLVRIGGAVMDALRWWAAVRT